MESFRVHVYKILDLALMPDIVSWALNSDLDVSVARGVVFIVSSQAERDFLARFGKAAEFVSYHWVSGAPVGSGGDLS